MKRERREADIQFGTTTKTATEGTADTMRRNIATQRQHNTLQTSVHLDGDGGHVGGVEEVDHSHRVVRQLRRDGLVHRPHYRRAAHLDVLHRPRGGYRSHVVGRLLAREVPHLKIWPDMEKYE